VGQLGKKMSETRGVDGFFRRKESPRYRGKKKKKHFAPAREKKPKNPKQEDPNTLKRKRQDFVNGGI